VTLSDESVQVLILPHVDTEAISKKVILQAIKMNFLVQSLFHSVECILAYRATNGSLGSSSLMHA